MTWQHELQIQWSYIWGDIIFNRGVFAFVKFCVIYGLSLVLRKTHSHVDACVYLYVFLRYLKKKMTNAPLPNRYLATIININLDCYSFMDIVL